MDDAEGATTDGFIDHYVLDPRDRFHRRHWLWGVAHLMYWDDPGLYEFLATRLL